MPKTQLQMYKLQIISYLSGVKPQIPRSLWVNRCARDRLPRKSCIHEHGGVHEHGGFICQVPSLLWRWANRNFDKSLVLNLQKMLKQEPNMSVSALWAPRRGVSTLICLVLVCGEDPNYKDLSYDLTSRDSKTCETLEFQKTIKVPLKNSCNNKLITFFLISSIKNLSN